MKTLKLFTITVLGVAALAACHREEADENRLITVKASIGSMTKVSYDGNATSFTEGDKITVYGWIGSASQVAASKVVDGVNNTLGSDGKWVPEKTMLWIDATSDHYFLSVYPPRKISDFTGDAYTLNPTDYEASDLLIATNLSGLKASSTPVSLAFDHAMAKLNVNLRFSDQWGETPTVSRISVTAKTNANINYLTKSVTATGGVTAVEIPAAASAPDGYALSFSSLMVPQSGVRTIVITIDGQSYIHKASNDIPLMAGKFTNLDLIVDSDKKESDINLGSVSVTDWVESEVLPEGETLLTMYNNHEYVEMGDGLKWATCNVGANSPEEYGGYFAWGEMETKTNYSQDTYRWEYHSMHVVYEYDGYDSYEEWFSKYYYYCDYCECYSDWLKELEYSDDAARWCFGFPWRIPTDNEWGNLLNTDNFTWTWTDNYAGTGVKGYTVTSKVAGYEGNTIFLPAAGYWIEDSLDDAGERCLFWSSSLYNNFNARNACFNASEVGRSFDRRIYGLSVRPVAE